MLMLQGISGVSPNGPRHRRKSVPIAECRRRPTGRLSPAANRRGEVGTSAELVGALLCHSVEPRPELAAVIKQSWPALRHVGRLDVAMNDEGLRLLSQVPDHSWGIEGH